MEKGGVIYQGINFYYNQKYFIFFYNSSQYLKYFKIQCGKKSRKKIKKNGLKTTCHISNATKHLFYFKDDPYYVDNNYLTPENKGKIKYIKDLNGKIIRGEKSDTNMVKKYWNIIKGILHNLLQKE